MSRPSSTNAARHAADGSTGLRFVSEGRTHRGMVRKLNEDAFIENPEAGLWAVADGMGGHNSGDFASALVIRRLGSIGPAETAYALRREVARQLKLANEELLASAEGGSRGAMGATVAVLTVCRGYYSCTWAGDSRVYLLRKGRLRQITTDHSVVQTLVDAGEISAEEARHHSRAHIVTRAIGANGQLLLETANGELEPGDRFLLCSDGLASVMEDRQILELIANQDSQVAIDSLIRHTLENGAPDNVTAILTDTLG